MRRKMRYGLILCGLTVLLAGCGNSTKMVLDTQENIPTNTADKLNEEIFANPGQTSNQDAAAGENDTIAAAEGKDNDTAEVIAAADDSADAAAATTDNSADTVSSNTDTSSGETISAPHNQTENTADSDAAAAGGSLYTTLTPDSNGNVVISKESIGSTASYYNYKSGDTIVQLIGIATQSGEKRLAFNTCQSCNPSPQAYYQQQGDLLICQNCGFDFVPEDVGAVAGGCNPMPLEQLTEEDGQFLIPASYLDTFADVYASWTGPTS